MSTTTRGVRKVSENILSNGRAIIVTEKDKDKYKWADIPVGSKFIDSKTGIEWVKLEGESDWVPAHVKNDGTLCIAKDTIIKEETFTIKSLDDGNKTFTYINSKGEIRHMPLTDEGYHVFEVENGNYMPNRNQLEIWIDDVLRRNASSGGLLEINEHRFILTEQLSVGMEITAKYASIFRIGNPYPRIFINKNTPADSEIGDFWLDTDAQLSDELGENIEGQDWKVPFDNIVGKPTTIKGYGIIDKISYEGHTHKVSEISGLPVSLPANGGNSDTVDYCHAGENAGNVLKVRSNGKISPSVIPDHTHTVSEIKGLSSAINPVAAKLGQSADTTKPMQFNWNGQNGQPTWVWGGNDGKNMYVYNPVNFTVAKAKFAESINPSILNNLVNYGKNKPTMTPLVDWDAMSAKFGYNPIRINVTSVFDDVYATKSIPACFNLRNNGSAVYAYGGDNARDGLNHGDIILKQDWHDFDKICIYGCNDDANLQHFEVHDVYLLNFAFEHFYSFPIISSMSNAWYVFGIKKQGLNNVVHSTNTLWRCRDQNCGIIEIYGIKY